MVDFFLSSRSKWGNFVFGINADLDTSPSWLLLMINTFRLYVHKLSQSQLQGISGNLNVPENRPINQNRDHVLLFIGRIESA